MKRVLTLSFLLLLSGCTMDPSAHSNLGPPQVVITAYDLAVKGDLPGTQKYFSAKVQAALKEGTTLEKVWEMRTLKGLVKAINVSNQKEAGKDTVIIEGHVMLASGMIQEIEELVVKEKDVWVIEGVNPKYTPGMPEMPVGVGSDGGAAAEGAQEAGGE